MEKLEQNNIVDSAEGEISKDISKKPSFSVVSHNEVAPEKESPEEKKPKFSLANDVDAPVFDNIHEGFDVEDYKEYLGNDIFMPTGGVEALNKQRAEYQPWTDQAMNMVGQAVVGEIIGGTIEGLGYLLEIGNAIDYAMGNEREWGNFMTDAGKDLRTWGQENMAIHQTNEGTFNPSDSGWWFSNGVSVASTLSMMVPSMAATRALGFLGKTASKGAGLINKSLDIASKMGKQGKWMTEGISQAVVSRHIENSMEASGTFNDQKSKYLNTVDPETGANFTDEKASRLASEAAASNYRAGWAMLLQDIPQYLAIGKVFNPNTMKMENAISKAAKNGKNIGVKPWKTKLGAAAGTFASEGFEESYQYYIAERGKALSDLKAGLIDEEKYNEMMYEAIGSDEMMTSAFFGGLGGNIFQTVGPAIGELTKSKARKESDKKAGEEYEKKVAEFDKRIQDRAKSFTAMQIELAKIDQTGDSDKRDAVVDEMMLGMTIEAVAGGRFDTHIQTLEGMSKMSPEEVVAFEKEQGMEVNKELIQKYTPKLIEKAYDIRKSFLKHSNKHDANTAALLARNEYYVKKFNEDIVRLEKNEKEIINSIPNVHGITTTQREKLDAKLKLNALKFVEKVHRDSYEKADDNKKKRIQSVIDDNLKAQEVANRIATNKGDDPRDSDSKSKDRRLSEGFLGVKEELEQNIAERLLLDDAILLFQKESKLVKTDKFKSEQKKKEIKRNLNKVNTPEEIQKAKEDISTSKDLDEKEKAEANKVLDGRLAEIKREAKKQSAEALTKSHNDQLEDSAAAAIKDNPATVTNVNAVPITDSVEDEFADDEVDVEVQLSKPADKSIENKVKAGSNIKLLDKVATAEFKEWVFNGKDKTGTQVEIKLGDPVNKYAKEAIAKFKAGTLDESVFKNLPLKVELAPGIHTFIPGYTSANTHFMTNEYPKRIAIIKALKQGKVTTEVSHQAGGNLQLAPSVNEEIPVNSLLDLMPIAGKMDNLDLMVSNENGQLVDLDKNIHSDFVGVNITLNGVQDDKGGVVGYKGGVFLNVPKANGYPFPLKVNLARPSVIQAEFLADLLVHVVSTKGTDLDSPLAVAGDLFEEFKNNHPEEYKLLGTTASINDVIQLFIHMSGDTEGKTSRLYLSGERVVFGVEKDNFVTAKNVGDYRSKLIAFLSQKKRRQFDLNKWNEDSKYRDYMIKNKIINTDAVVNKPLFTDETPIGVDPKDKYSSDIYIKAVEAPLASSNQSEIDKIEAERQAELNNSSQVKTSTKEYTVKTTDGDISTVKVDMYADGSSVVTKSVEGEVYSKDRLNKEQSQDKNILLGLTESVKNEGEIEYTVQVVAKVISEKNLELRSNKAADKINAKYDAKIKALKEGKKPPKATSSKEHDWINKREADTLKKGVFRDEYEKNLLAIEYTNPDGTKYQMNGTNKEALIKLVKDQYQAERSQLPAAPVERKTVKETLANITAPVLDIVKPVLFNRSSIVDFLQTQGLSSSDSKLVYDSLTEEELKLIGQGKNLNWKVIQDRINEPAQSSVEKIEAPEKADNFNIKKGVILYDSSNPEGFTIKAFSVGGKGSDQYLKGILFTDNKTKKEFWWNRNSKWDWEDMFIMSQEKDVSLNKLVKEKQDLIDEATNMAENDPLVETKEEIKDEIKEQGDPNKFDSEDFGAFDLLC